MFVREAALQNSQFGPNPDQNNLERGTLSQRNHQFKVIVPQRIKAYVPLTQRCGFESQLSSAQK